MDVDMVLAALFAACPRLTLEQRREYAPLLLGACDRFGIVTEERFAAFLAQVAHESQGLTRWTENLNYSPEGLMRIWPKRFNATQAARYGRKPEAIANRVYADRLGNGDEASGDGWRYRGRGPIQLTGRENYRTFGKKLGLDLEALPEQVATPRVGFEVAAAFWRDRGCNELADAGDFLNVTKRVNGGLIGLSERMRCHETIRALWDGTEVDDGTRVA